MAEDKTIYHGEKWKDVPRVLREKGISVLLFICFWIFLAIAIRAYRVYEEPLYTIYAIMTLLAGWGYDMHKLLLAKDSTFTTDEKNRKIERLTILVIIFIFFFVYKLLDATTY